MKEPILEFVTLRSEEARNAGMSFYLEHTTDVEVDKKLERELLNKFQKNVMDTFVEVIAESPHVGDDFLDDEDPDVVAVWRMIKECGQFIQADEIISIIPLDFIGNLGFVIATHPLQFQRG